jgi:hypothetical protein
MGMALSDVTMSWPSVTAAEVAEALAACTDLLGQIRRTEHGPFGDIYAEFEVHGPSVEAYHDEPEPETIITAWTQTLTTGTKSLSIRATYDSEDTREILEVLFDAVDGFVEDPVASARSVL